MAQRHRLLILDYPDTIPLVPPLQRLFPRNHVIHERLRGLENILFIAVACPQFIVT